MRSWNLRRCAGHLRDVRITFQPDFGQLCPDVSPRRPSLVWRFDFLGIGRGAWGFLLELLLRAASLYVPSGKSSRHDEPHRISGYRSGDRGLSDPCAIPNGIIASTEGEAGPALRVLRTPPFAGHQVLQ